MRDIEEKVYGFLNKTPISGLKTQLMSALTWPKPTSASGHTNDYKRERQPFVMVLKTTNLAWLLDQQYTYIFFLELINANTCVYFCKVIKQIIIMPYLRSTGEDTEILI